MRAERPGAPSDGVMLAAAAIVAATGAVVWLWGATAGTLFGRGSPDLGPGQLLGVLIRLPARLGDPASAWPAPARASLPSAAGCYAALVAVLLAVAGAVWSLRRAAGTLLPRRHGARWARHRELRQLEAVSALPARALAALASRAAPVRGDRARSQGRTRLALGRHRGRLLYAEQRHALIAFGPPQSGKSAGLAVPALLEWEGPAVASSIKSDLLLATLARRRSLGPAFVFDPFGLSGISSHTWSPLPAASTWDGALEVAWRLACAGEVDHRNVEGGDFWATAAEQRLAPLLFAAARSGGGVEALVRWVYGQGARELHTALAEIAGEATNDAELSDAHAAYDAVRAFEAQADRTRSSIEATAQGLLRAYRFARVARSAGGREIDPDVLLDAPATLYLVGDAKASKLLRPIFLALLSELVDRAYERATRNGGRLEQPLLLCLDEAGNVAPLPNLAEVASTAPSHGIQLLSIFHDLQQARARYGKQAETVINSHRARMLLPGVGDLETLRYFAAMLGESEIRELTRTTGDGGTSRSVSSGRRPLSAPEALRQLPDGEALLLYGRLAPARVRLRLWFRDRRLRKLGGS